MNDSEIPLRRALRNFEDRTPPERVSYTCEICDGKGRIGCTPECFEPISRGMKMVTRICEENHTCTFCRGEGEYSPTIEDIRNEKRNW